MKRRPIVLALFVAACLYLIISYTPLLGLGNSDESDDHNSGPSWSQIRDIHLRERELDAERVQVNVFRERLAQLKAELADGSETLERISTALVAMALEKNPRFLTGLAVRYRGVNRNTAVAFSLVENLLWESKQGKLTSQQLTRLEQLTIELEQLSGADSELLCQLLYDVPRHRVKPLMPQRPSSDEILMADAE